MKYVLLFWYCYATCGVGSAEFDSMANCDAAAAAWQGNQDYLTVGGVCSRK